MKQGFIGVCLPGRKLVFQAGAEIFELMGSDTVASHYLSEMLEPLLEEGSLYLIQYKSSNKKATTIKRLPGGSVNELPDGVFYRINNNPRALA